MNGSYRNATRNKNREREGDVKKSAGCNLRVQRRESEREKSKQRA